MLNLPLERQLASIMSRNRDGSFATQDKRANVLMAVTRMVHAKFGLQKWANLGTKHVAYVVEIWKADRTESRAIEGNLSHLRWLVQKIGKANLMPRTNRGLGIEPALRHTHAGKVVSEAQFQADLRAFGQDARLRAMALAGRYLGMRFKEAALFRPDRQVEGNRLWLHRGTKGGRPRYLTLHHPKQWEAIEAIRQAAGPGGTLIPPEARTFKSWSEEVYGKLRAVGIGQKGSHVFHDYRRTYAVERLREQIARGRDCLAAAKLLSREVGHSRTDVLAWYIAAEELHETPDRAAA